MENQTTAQTVHTQLTLKEAAKLLWQKKITFKGKATRDEYWLGLLAFYLSCILPVMIIFVIAILGTVKDNGKVAAPILAGLGIIVGIIAFLINISLTARRLHDIGKSGWWQLISLIPYIGTFIVFIWNIYRSSALDSFENQLGLKDAAKLLWQNKFNFSGRASRSEYWLAAVNTNIFGMIFYVALVLINLISLMIAGYPFMDFINGILLCFISVFTILLMISVTIRRLHDIGRSGWWILLHLGLGIGSLILTFWMIYVSDEDNKYGTKAIIK